MTHLTQDELIDAVEQALPEERRRHLDACAACEREVAQLSSVLLEARDLNVPEPSPLFWDHLSARVRAAVQAEPSPGGGWSRWLTWPVLAPLGAMALVVLALVTAMPRQAPPPSRPQAQVASDTGPADAVVSDDGWVLVADLVGDLDWDTASEAGLLVQPGSADRAALELSTPERQELGRLLQAALVRAKS